MAVRPPVFDPVPWELQAQWTCAPLAPTARTSGAGAWAASAMAAVLLRICRH